MCVYDGQREDREKGGQFTTGDWLKVYFDTEAFSLIWSDLQSEMGIKSQIKMTKRKDLYLTAVTTDTV